MKNIIAAVTILGAVVATAPAAAQVSLQNGSFEAIGQQYSPAIGGLSEASGWVNSSGLNIQASSALAGVEGTSASAVTGARFLRLVSDNPDPQNTGSIYQQLGSIVAGRRYTITGTALGGDSINNLWGGLFSLTSAATGGQTFASTSVSGLSAGASTTFSFGFDGTVANAGQSVFLRLLAAPSGLGQDIRGGVDNLQLSEVAAVPEPATWGMMLVGFGMMGAGMRRRKSDVRTSVRFA